jgi:ABC-type multidrug transport system ATPase subunit
LLKRQTGQIMLLGRPFGAHRIALLRRIGSLIESPSLYASLTAVENLQVLQRVYRSPAGRIEQVLRLTGLADTGRKKAGQFSLGMKQRLAIAIALLNDPALLILDPEGIAAMRSLFRTLNREHGVTILVSSHLLGEMEKLITHTGIIHKGRLLFQGPLETLKQMHPGEDLENIFLHLTTSHP